MTTSAAQAAAFFKEVAESNCVSSVRDEGGFPAPLTAEGVRSMPFWSKRSRAEKVVASVAAYSGMTVVEIPLADFLERWLPGLAEDGQLIGINWSGPHATGYDLTPGEVADRIGVAPGGS